MWRWGCTQGTGQGNCTLWRLGCIGLSRPGPLTWQWRVCRETRHEDGQLGGGGRAVADSEQWKGGLQWVLTPNKGTLEGSLQFNSSGISRKNRTRTWDVGLKTWGLITIHGAATCPHNNPPPPYQMQRAGGAALTQTSRVPLAAARLAQGVWHLKWLTHIVVTRAPHFP